MANSARVAKTRKEASVGNLEAARVIAADTRKYGPESLAAQWARLWLANHRIEDTAE
jgi:hypothetical protein